MQHYLLLTKYYREIKEKVGSLTAALRHNIENLERQAQSKKEVDLVSITLLCCPLI
jgi:hypothetical protein